MSRVNSVGYYIEMLKSFDEDEIVAIPFIWTKEDVNEAFEVELDDATWDTIEELYVQNEYFCDTSFETMAECVNREVRNK